VSRRSETLLWVAQRASAAVLAVCVLVHLATIIYAVQGGLSGAEILARTRGNSAWFAFYTFFVLAVAVHAPIGLRAVLAEWLGWRGRADEVTKVRGMFIHPRQADEVVARFPEIVRYQVMVTRTGHQDEMTFQVELGPAGGGSSDLISRVESTIREVMKLRGDVAIVPPGTIPDGAKKIVDRRKWD